jgi:hypothetical protein
MAKKQADAIYRIMPANTTHKPSVKTVGAPAAKTGTKVSKAKVVAAKKPKKAASAKTAKAPARPKRAKAKAKK